MTQAATIAGEPAAAASRTETRHLSHVLLALSAQATGKVSVRDISVALADRSFGAFLVVFALPNLIPLPPGATCILGLPLIFVAWQMVASRQSRIWLPRRLADYAFESAAFADIVRRIMPWLVRAERLVKPRAWFLDGRVGERTTGLLALVLAIVVFLPIPLGNFLPSVALAIIGFAHTERDGLALAAGCALGLVSLIVAFSVVLAAGAVFALLF
ncbi:exopolysaccharide biosynthesis protein [Ensifer soli]|uniref:exopolysaccharide biosynthesis protein n=1 Tax=Ciceribacter sp. sgz301302 TaxID=3342379 RepID=UPI0035B7CE0A